MTRQSMTQHRNLRTTLLIFGAFGFSFNLGNAVHEFGHAVADYAGGIPSSNIHIILHPFVSPHMAIDGAIPDSLMGLPDAAGPLANVLLGLILFVISWKIRKPYLLPFLFCGPLACVQEGFGQIVNISQTGTDAARMVAAGFPSPALVLISALLLLAGVVLFVMAVSVSGIHPNDRLPKRLGVLAAGMLPYGFIVLVVNLLTNAPRPDISRSTNIIAGFAIIVVLVSLLYRPVNGILNRFTSNREYHVSGAASLFALGTLIGITLLQLRFLN